MTNSSIKNSLKTLMTGQLLMIETEMETLVGNLHKIDVNTNFIILNSVKDVKNNVEFTTRQVISLQAIKDLKPINPDNVELSDSVENSETASTASFESCETLSHQTSSTSNNSLPLVNLSNFEKQLLQTQLESVIMLSQKGIEFNKAIDDFKTEQVFALLIHPIDQATKTISLITIATVKMLYIFDIKAFGQLPQEMKDIFESRRPRKAIYGSHSTVDYFQHQLNININGIFDTHSTYYEVTNQKENFDFQKVVEQCFKYSDLKSDKIFNSYNSFQRPLKNAFVLECAKRAFFNLKLQEYLEKQVLQKFYQQCENFSRMYADAEDIAEMATAMKNDIRYGIEDHTYKIHLTSRKNDS